VLCKLEIIIVSTSEPLSSHAVAFNRWPERAVANDLHQRVRELSNKQLKPLVHSFKDGSDQDRLRVLSELNITVEAANIPQFRAELRSERARRIFLSGVHDWKNACTDVTERAARRSLAEQLTALARDAHSMGSIELLNWSHQPITTLPKAIYRLTGLKELYLRDTQLSVLGGDIKKLQQLQILDLSRSCISDLPAELLELPQLKEINIDGTALAQDPMQQSTSVFRALNLAGQLRLKGFEHYVVEQQSLHDSLVDLGVLDRHELPPVLLIERDDMHEQPLQHLSVVACFIDNHPKAILEVEFDGEEAVDHGGLSRSLWTDLAQCLFSSDSCSDRHIYAMAENASEENPLGEGLIPVLRLGPHYPADSAALQQLGKMLAWGHFQSLLFPPLLSKRLFAALLSRLRQDDPLTVLAQLTNNHSYQLLAEHSQWDDKEFVWVSEAAALYLSVDPSQIDRDSVSRHLPDIKQAITDSEWLKLDMLDLLLAGMQAADPRGMQFWQESSDLANFLCMLLFQAGTDIQQVAQHEWQLLIDFYSAWNLPELAATGVTVDALQDCFGHRMSQDPHRNPVALLQQLLLEIDVAINTIRLNRPSALAAVTDQANLKRNQIFPFYVDHFHEHFVGSLQLDALLAAISSKHPEDQAMQERIIWMRNWLKDPIQTDGQAPHLGPKAEQQRRKFLNFVTGRETLLLGEQIYLLMAANINMLQAHTCFNRLDIPSSIQTEAAFREQLDAVLRIFVEGYDMD